MHRAGSPPRAASRCLVSPQRVRFQKYFRSNGRWEAPLYRVTRVSSRRGPRRFISYLRNVGSEKSPRSMVSVMQQSPVGFQGARGVAQVKVSITERVSKPGLSYCFALWPPYWWLWMTARFPLGVSSFFVDKLVRISLLLVVVYFGECWTKFRIYIYNLYVIFNLNLCG